MKLVVDVGQHYSSLKGRVFRVVIEEEERHPHMSMWKQPSNEELPWWLAQLILEEACSQIEVC